MKKWIILFTALLLSLSIYIFRDNFHQIQLSPKHKKVNGELSSVLSHDEKHQVSLTLAHLFWNQLLQYSPFYDFDEVMENLHNLEKGKIKPLDKNEYQQQLLSFLHKMSDYHDRFNLEAVEAYLSEIAARESVVEVVPQKVYYEVLQSGNGVTSSDSIDSTFKMHLIESRLLEGEEIVIKDTRAPNKPITLLLSDTILGFAKGASGMIFGERRKIYIHPDLAYGKYGHQGYQQIMIYDVERL